MRFTLLIILVIISMGFIFWKDINHVMDNIKAPKNQNKEKKISNKESADPSSSGVSVIKKWDLPKELKEVSGIAYLDQNTFACIQDEDGIIFIYNRSSNTIEKEISFAGGGDYEGLTVKGSMAYVVRSDGRIFEVDLNRGNPSVKEYDTPLTSDHNVEGLCFDKKNNRLLLAIKDEEPGNKNYKGIYAFNLSTKTLAKEPVLQINLNDKILNAATGKKSKTIKPSALGIHPVTNDLYITDGPEAKMLIMDATGTIKNFVSLGKDFAQPEGITFSPQGDIFISNEGTKQPGNIMQVKINY